VSKQSNPALIGAFVIGSLAVLVTFLLVFGGGTLLRETQSYVVHFDGSISGLRVGANVNFRGVPVGEVKDISVVYDTADQSFSIPVSIDIDERRFILATGGGVSSGEEDQMPALVESGLRAQLVMQSFVTGLLEVQLDMTPDTEIVYRGIGSPTEIPSIPSTAQQVSEQAERLVAQLHDVPIRELISKAASAASGLDELLNSPDMQALPGTLRRSLRTLDGTLGEVSGESDLYHRVSAALDEIAAAARALRLLTEYLEQNPEALVRGRSNR